MLKSLKVLFLLLLLPNKLSFIFCHDTCLLSIVLPANLAEANKRTDALALKLEQSEKARKKAESDAAAVKDLRKRLHDAKTSLSDNIAQQSAREDEILTRLESQSRRFVSKCSTICAFPRVTSHCLSTLYLRATLCLFRENSSRIRSGWSCRRRTSRRANPS